MQQIRFEKARRVSNENGNNNQIQDFEFCTNIPKNFDSDFQSIRVQHLNKIEQSVNKLNHRLKQRSNLPQPLIITKQKGLFESAQYLIKDPS